MLRASALAEELGVPSVSLTCEGFLGQAASTAAGLGMPNLPVALVPGHVDVQTAEELRRNVLGEASGERCLADAAQAKQRDDAAAVVHYPAPQRLQFLSAPLKCHDVGRLAPVLPLGHVS